MTSPARSRVFACVAAVAAFSVLLPVTPTQAAAVRARTSISAHLSATATLAGSTATVSGTVKPAGGTLTLERLSGKDWVAVSSKKPTTTGAFVFAVRTPKAGISLPLRVTRRQTSKAKAGVSATLRLHSVRTSYTVAAVPAMATVTSPMPVTVAGAVLPRAHGSVRLQALTGHGWVTVATAGLSATSTFRISAAHVPGRVQLRVLKPNSSTIAAGASAAFRVTVLPPVPMPSITTVALPQGRVAVAYFALLAAAGGAGPYSWSATGLPPGLGLSTAGLLSGTPTTTGTTHSAFTVTDALGRRADLVLPVAVAAPAGRLFSVGLNQHGQLGNSTAVPESDTIVPVTGQVSVVSAVSVAFSTYALDADGTVWAWGWNTGQLGAGSPGDNDVPARVIGLTNVTAIAAVSNALLALRADGTVWALGRNDYGELGDNSTDPSAIPVQVIGLTSVVAIAGGGTTSYAVRSDGTAWAWGYNGFGAVGDGTTTERLVPTQVSELSGVVQIAAGTSSAYAVRNDGAVFAWGTNFQGQLGDGTQTDRHKPVRITGLPPIKAIAAGSDNGYALTTTGTVMSWGTGATGSLGNGTTTLALAPVMVHNLTGVLEIAGNGETAAARTPDGSTWMWGDNASGQLGDGTTMPRAEPVQMTGVTGTVALSAGQNGSTNYVILG